MTSCSGRSEALLTSLGANFRYASGLRSFLRKTLDVAQARAMITQQMQRRDEAFFSLLERGVYGNANSPYRRLLEHFGISLEDVRALVQKLGLEGALSELYDRGVYITLEEFKGRRPVERDGLRFNARASDFDNPFLAAHYAGATSGTRGIASRVLIDLDFLEYDAAHLLCFLDANAATGRPVGVWRVGPPGSDGLRGILRYAKLGNMPQRWFSSGKPLWNAEGMRARVFLAFNLAASRIAGRPMPAPRFVPRQDAASIASWLAGKTAAGTPGLLIGNATPITRVCLAAREHGIDISGTAFVPGGEPLTPGKYEIMRSAGTRPLPAYALQEIGTVSFGCAAPQDIDDMHVLRDKVGLVVRQKQLAGTSVQALIYTSLLPASPKLMLNTESGDYATVTRRRCGCALDELGFETHIAGVRSYEKLTSEGVTFMGSGLYDLVETILPARFGGVATDYQFVEEEEQGLARVSIVVAPGVGPVDEAALIATTLAALRQYPGGGPLMAGEWEQGNTLRVQRREPYAGSNAKVQPLHVVPAPRASRA